MNILAIDAAGAVLSVALSAPSGIYSLEMETQTGHSERLMEGVAFLFESAALEREELELAACMEGPGSFTGLRIGYAAAKGLSLALGIPLVPVPTLDCMAFPHSAWPGPVVPAIDAKKKLFFTGLYYQGEKIAGPLDAAPEEIRARLGDLRSRFPETEAAPALVTGPGAPLLLAALADPAREAPAAGDFRLDPAHRRGRARELLEISWKNTIVSGRNVFAPDGAGPLYLRKSDAELKL